MTNDIASEAMNLKFSVNDAVYVYTRDLKGWSRGQVVEVCGNNIYKVAYRDYALGFKKKTAVFERVANSLIQNILAKEEYACSKGKRTNVSINQEVLLEGRSRVLFKVLKSIFVQYDDTVSIESVKWISFCITKNISPATYTYRIGCMLCPKAMVRIGCTYRIE